jgi:uncharacterized protein (TIGR03067 family)
MKRSILFAAIVALFAGAAWAQTAEKAETPLEGTWLLTAMKQKDQAVPDERLPLGVVRFKGDQATIVMWDMQCKATVKVDAEAKPGTIDVTHTDGTHKGESQFAVFSIEGDEVTIRGTAPGAPPESRPKSVESGEGLWMKFRKIDLKAKDK